MSGGKNTKAGPTGSKFLCYRCRSDIAHLHVTPQWRETQNRNSTAMVSHDTSFLPSALAPFVTPCNSTHDVLKP
ncbi:hypothetical protein AB1N83_003807 [Pleurotus pulmonarius]